MPGILPAGGPVLIIHGDIFGGIKYIIGLLRCIALEVDRTQVWTVAKSTVAQECNAGRDRHRLQRSAAVKGVSCSHFLLHPIKHAASTDLTLGLSYAEALLFDDFTKQAAPAGCPRTDCCFRDPQMSRNLFVRKSVKDFHFQYGAI